MRSASALAAEPLVAGGESAATQHAMQLLGEDHLLSTGQLVLATRVLDADLHYYVLGTHAAIVNSGQAFAFALFGLAVSLFVVGVETGYRLEAGSDSRARITLIASSPALLCLLLAGTVMVVTLTRDRAVTTTPLALTSLEELAETTTDNDLHARDAPVPSNIGQVALVTPNASVSSRAGLGNSGELTPAVDAIIAISDLNKSLKVDPENTGLSPTDRNRLDSASRTLDKFLFGLAEQRWSSKQIDRYFEIKRDGTSPLEDEQEWYQEMKRWLR